MIKIRLNDNEKLVTKGAYKEFYEHLGYKIVNEQEKPLKKEVEISLEKPSETIKEDKGERERFSRK